MARVKLPSLAFDVFPSKELSASASSLSCPSFLEFLNTFLLRLTGEFLSIQFLEPDSRGSVPALQPLRRATWSKSLDSRSLWSSSASADGDNNKRFSGWM